MTEQRHKGWEQKVLGFLSYPANIVLGGLAAFLLALPVVTLMPAAIALARAFSSWRDTGNDEVFTNTFREFAATWRRSLGLGFVALVPLALLVGDILFLLARLADEGGNPLALLISAAFIPVAAVLCLMLLAIPVAAAHEREGSWRTWLRAAAVLVVMKPLNSFMVLLVLLTVLLVCIVFPTMIPFIGISAPIYLALVFWATQSSGVRSR